MFVPEIRLEIREMVADGLSLNEIAHRLGVARATVGYHVQALRDARGGPSRPGARPTAPLAAPDVTRARVRASLKQVTREPRSPACSVSPDPP
jgi:transposase-like protein